MICMNQCVSDSSLNCSQQSSGAAGKIFIRETRVTVEADTHLLERAWVWAKMVRVWEKRRCPLLKRSMFETRFGGARNRKLIRCVPPACSGSPCISVAWFAKRSARRTNQSRLPAISHITPWPPSLVKQFISSQGLLSMKIRRDWRELPGLASLDSA